MKIIESKKIKKEPKEATGAASAGNSVSAPAFSMWSNDEKAKKEYKRMEGEFKEATDSSSVGPYDANSFEDINMRGNSTKGNGRSWKKTQIPGGSFVVIRKGCMKFPYCSQGNSKDKPVIEKKPKKKSPVNEAIFNISKKTGLTEESIKYLIIKSINGKI